MAYSLCSKVQQPIIKISGLTLNNETCLFRRFSHLGRTSLLFCKKEEAMIKAIVLILIGFALLIKGADFLVEGSSKISKRFHIPEIIIGLTIVSIGTSMPELFVSITSALEGYPDMAIGNVLRK